ncbi:unnamed protein product [Cunninghamella blakesleeana]
MWRKRLFQTISDEYNSSIGKRFKGTNDLPCPNCHSPLFTSTQPIGLSCEKCTITIPLSSSDLSPQKIMDMIHSARQLHQNCTGNQSTLEITNLGIPDGDEFLVWKCKYCGEVEILL